MRFDTTHDGDFVPSRTGDIVIDAPTSIEDNWRGHFKRYRRMQKQIEARYDVQRRIRDHEEAVARERAWAEAVLACEGEFCFQGYVKALQIMGIEPTPSDLELADEEAKEEYGGMVERIHELWT